jgi:DNA polymerase-1
MNNIIGVEDILKCSGKVVAIDTETTGLRWWENHIIGVSVECPSEGVRGYMPTLDEREIKAAKSAVRSLESKTVVMMHNAKFDMHFLDIDPTTTGWGFIDTTILIHLIDSRYPKAMEKAEKIFLGTSSKRAHVTQAPSRKKIWEWPLETVVDYATNDAVVTYQLGEVLIPKVRKLGLWDLFLKDMKFLGTVWRAERFGVQIDPDFFYRAIDLQASHLAEMEQELYDSCGREFNWRSPQQLSKAIYEGLGIPKPKNPFADADGIDRSRFADSGLYKSCCTATQLLTEKIHHPLGELISAIRESARMKKTMEGYIDLADEGLFVHSNFKITGTRTGRLSSSQPNLQNVPSQVRGRFTQSVYTGSTERTAEYNLRNGFVARPGKVLLSVDYKQMEMRMFGILSQDQFMLDALKQGKDIHAEVAMKVWGVGDKVHREWSKTIGFGLIYGMTIGSLMFKLNKTKAEAGQIRDQYLSEFPRIMPWMNEVIEECKREFFVRYWSGRIWREEAYIDMYRAANAKIQGGCADLLSIASLRVDDWCRNQSDDHRIVSFVHDEIITEVPKEDEYRCARAIMDIMEVRDLFEIPFLTDAKSGTTYGNQEKLIIKELPETVSY